MQIQYFAVLSMSILDANLCFFSHTSQDVLAGLLPPDHSQPHPLVQECISKAQALVDSVSVEEVISALVFLDALARRPGCPREAVSCNRRIMARLVELCCVAPRKDILISSLSVKFLHTPHNVSFGFICLHHDQVLAHCSLITSCAEYLARDCMPPIERSDVREGVRKSFPPPPELCITQVPLMCLDLNFTF